MRPSSWRDVEATPANLARAGLLCKCGHSRSTHTAAGRCTAGCGCTEFRAAAR